VLFYTEQVGGLAEAIYETQTILRHQGEQQQVIMQLAQIIDKLVEKYNRDSYG
jgi:hypothetical protein